MSDKMSVKLLPCPFCGGEAKALTRSDGYEFTEYVMCGNCEAESGWFKTKDEAIATWNTRKPMERYEELERKLQSVYGECDGLLEKVVEGLVKHEGAEFEKPMKARLLTDEDVDKWDRLKGAKERIVERLERHASINDGCSPTDINFRAALNIAIEIVKEEMR